jgi:hypothetical protein
VLGYRKRECVAPQLKENKDGSASSNRGSRRVRRAWIRAGVAVGKIVVDVVVPLVPPKVSIVQIKEARPRCFATAQSGHLNDPRMECPSGSSIRGANNAKSEGIRDDRACL